MKKMIIMWALVSFLCGEDLLSGYYKSHISRKGRQAIIEIFKYEGKFYGYGFANVDNSPKAKDIHNKNPLLRERWDNEIIFLYGLQGDGEVYKNGLVYNIDNGETYNAKVTIKGNELHLRASIDSFGVVGQTRVWHKLSQEEVEPYLIYKIPKEVILKSLKDWDSL